MHTASRKARNSTCSEPKPFFTTVRLLTSTFLGHIFHTCQASDVLALTSSRASSEGLKVQTQEIDGGTAGQAFLRMVKLGLGLA